MPQLPPMLPCRRADLVSWRAEDNGHFLIRNRQTGDTFQLGEQEHFLLEQLDGRRTGAEVCQAFAKRFGEELSEEELAELVELANGRGLLQGNSENGAPNQFSVLNTHCSAPRPERGPRLILARLLTAFAAASKWLAGLFESAAQRIYWHRLKHFDYVPRPDDVFIVTYPRSGTTWMQMILYQLTTEGAMDFPHIAEYCPWFERSMRSGRGFETRPAPRIFKSHLSYRQIPKGAGKYIYVARDGKDVAVSCYHLYRRYNGYEGSFTEFFDQFLQGKVEFGSWFRHVKEWWKHRHDANVLFLTYEELTRDLEACIRKISKFCGFDVPEERLPAILERCSFGFMKKHESQFDPALESLWEQGVQLNAFLRNGWMGEGAVQLTKEQEARFDETLRRHEQKTTTSFPNSRLGTDVLETPFRSHERNGVS